MAASPLLKPFVGKQKERTQTKCEAARAAGESTLWPGGNAPPVPNINDLVRTRVECKFLDGVTFLTAKLAELATAHGKTPIVEPKGRLEGYFAQHFYFEEHVHFRFGGDVRPTVVRCEVQLATTLSTMVWETSHGLYERRRASAESNTGWQWDADSPHFLANQLGHMIHLADGLLVKLRDASKKVP